MRSRLVPPGSRERGAAVADFALVSIPLVVLFLGILQVGFAIHVRNTLTACAADGARYGANADRQPSDARLAAQRCIATALAPSLVQAVDAGYDGGLLAVRVTATLPVLGPLGPAKAITVTGHAVPEATL